MYLIWPRYSTIYGDNIIQLNIHSRSGEMRGYQYLNEYHFKKKKNEQFLYQRKHGLYVNIDVTPSQC